MFRACSFRVSPQSMVVLCLVSVACTLGVHYGDQYAGFPITKFILALMAWVEFQTAYTVVAALRGCIILALCVFPFRTHLQERPALFWVTFGTSLVGTSLPWILLGLEETLMAGISAHVMAFLIFGIVMWEPKDDKPLQQQNS